MASTEALTLTSSHLFCTAEKSFHHHPSPPPLSLSPFPSSFPQSKHIPKTRFLVDAFRYAGDHSVSYFLSHFHSDHYIGLSPNWSKGIIFCSQTTARLLVQVLKVPSVFVFALPLRESVIIDGSEIVLIDANHCPGAVQFLFKIPFPSGNFERYVHTGDFRFCHSMKSDIILREFVGSDAIFLDTTYCNPKFVFPSQEESIDYIVSVIERVASESKGSMKDVLFLVATYVIGKEKILLEIARKCNRKIYVDAKKMAVLHVLGCEETEIFTEDESESDVHVVGWNVLGETWPYFRPNFLKIKEIMVERGYSKAIGFVPTGWTYEVKRNKFSVRSKDSFDIHLVPYSEHSNYEELREYVRLLKPKRVIPTVGLDVEKLDGEHANKMKKHFAGLVDEMANKQEFLKGFHRGYCEVSDKDGKDTNNGPSKELHLDKKTESSILKVDENNDIGFGFESSLPLQESDSQNIMVLSDEEVEKTLQELRDCLPLWVTRDQMLNLIATSSRDIVQSVSTFYEHETEFHEQARACSTSSSTSQINLLNDSTPLLQTTIKNNSPSGKIEAPLTQDYKVVNIRQILKSGVSLSPGKRKKTIETKQNKKVNLKAKSETSGLVSGASAGKRKNNIENKQNKKVKLKSMSETSGSKQPTITKFFSKVLANGSQGADTTLHDKIPEDENLSSDDTKQYKKEIDQFIKIINMNESLRSYAAMIVEKTKGDINLALDIYYSNPEGAHGGSEVGLDTSRHSQLQCSIISRSSGQKKLATENLGKKIEYSTQELLLDNADTTSVSLSPEKYNPVEHACWRDGQRAPYLHLARTFDLLENEKGKIKATSMLCNMFRSLLALSPEDVLPAVYLCTNKIAADHENKELNIGGGLVTSALEEACGTSRSKLREMYNDLGDLGDVAQACRQTQTLLAPPSPLLIKDLFSTLQKISVQTGSGSTSRKKNLILNLMRSCREKEMKFLVRTLIKNLRIGAMMRTVLPALAQAVVMNSSPHESSKDELQSFSGAVVEAYNVVPSLELIVPSLMNNGIGFSSSTMSMIPGIPIKPMLAKITNGVPQAMKLFQNKAFTCEYKYDGQRAQIHKLPDGSFHVFSRNGDESTSRFPDLIDIMMKSCKPDAVTFILDAEIVAIDRKNSCKILSFQELSSRGRGSKDTSITLDSIKVDICVFVFDIMFSNGQPLLTIPLRQRRKYLRDLFLGEKLGYLEYANEMTVEPDDTCLRSESTLTKISYFLENAFLSSCEGIMVKSLDVDAGYSPSKRVDTWLKVKRDYVDGLNDSLDLVPIGAWHGNGRKAGWYSPFLMACYNPDTGEFQSVCRVMSGFSDSFYTEMKSFFSEEKILSKKPPYYGTAEVPDMWFSPELVWEIRGADFTLSPVHEAAFGLVHPSRGISIRFPRFIGSVSDRNPEECSTAADIAEMFHSQTRKMDVMPED
ncbi:DNA ligase 6-like isoform X2 [Humulus lupulus]|uniref:DNA ligase 6-like isoform X2 n=1 Tax=Humulus lupulus TaxID=3486 RepID=UPI002B402724|nr:DNA ligase 6-like isoform X2 [Humulus lupulus]